MQSQVSPLSRATLTEQLVAAKVRKSLTYAELAEGTGLSVPYVTATILGQHPLPAEAAQSVAARLDMGKEAAALLHTIRVCGSIPGNVPTDPTIYRFYEMVQVYGATLKALVHEQFGDGIEKVEDPEGGSRAVITVDGKFLPYKLF
ncbi:Cyanate hydratase [Candidatus Paraburkholderia calva]|nr:Cyanate hydratase [Candidatus Paraburkholderia calva]